jgi:formamidopyrimidine-DNA glycosylase
VPELPDLSIVADALHAALAGRSLVRADTPDALVVRGTPAELAALVGTRVERVRKQGKFLFVELDRGRIVFNPMLTGRFQLALPAAKAPTKTSVILRFGRRVGGTSDAADWTAGADWLPADGDEVEVRYRDPTRMGKVYSDEVLHAARLLPFRARRTLAADEVDGLYEAARGTVAQAIDVLRARVPPTFETQVRDFLAVHGKGGQACPRCGTKITEISPGGFVTSYCRGCQR